MAKTRQSTLPNAEHANFPRAGLLRRVCAMAYDVLVIAAILMLAGGAALALVVLLNTLGVIPLNEGEDHASLLENSWLYRAYLFAIIFWFYGGFWKRGGQTIGMRAWRLKVQNTDGSCISWRQSMIRFATALLGLSNLGVVLGNRHLGWHDALAKCEVVVLSPEANKLKNWQKFA